MRTHSIVEHNLGPEWDDALLQRLFARAEALGGAVQAVDWGLAGSQVLARYRIALPAGMVDVEVETYMGVVLRGRENPLRLLAEGVEASR